MRCLLYLALVWPLMAHADILVGWSPVMDDRVSGYILLHGGSSGDYTNVITVEGADTNRRVITNLFVGDNYMVIRAVGENNGVTIYSDYSNEAHYLNATRPNGPVNSVLEIIQL